MCNILLVNSCYPYVYTSELRLWFWLLFIFSGCVVLIRNGKNRGNVYNLRKRNLKYLHATYEALC